MWNRLNLCELTKLLPLRRTFVARRSSLPTVSLAATECSPSGLSAMCIACALQKAHSPWEEVLACEFIRQSPRSLNSEWALGWLSAPRRRAGIEEVGERELNCAAAADFLLEPKGKSTESTPLQLNQKEFW